MPSGLTSMSSGSSRACRIADVSGVKALVPSPWYDCVQSIGDPASDPFSPGWLDCGASGSGVPETAGTGVRVPVGAGAGLAEEEEEGGGLTWEMVVFGGGGVEEVDCRGAEEEEDACGYAFALEALTRVRAGSCAQFWGAVDVCSWRETARSGVNVREAIVGRGSMSLLCWCGKRDSN